MLISILLTIAIIGVLFVVLTNGERPVEKLQDFTLQNLEKVITNKIRLNMNNGQFGTNEDLKDRAKLGEIQAEIQKRKDQSFVVALSKTYNDTVSELSRDK